MASVASSLPRARMWRVRPWVIVSLFCAAAAAAYGWMRVPVGIAQAEGFRDLCQGVGMHPGDWPCEMTSMRTVTVAVASSLLTWVAVALPGVLLAASGRRYTWAIPAALAAAATAIAGGSLERLFGVDVAPMAISGRVASFWVSHPLVAVAADLVLVSVPAAAVAFVVRPPRRPPAVVPRRHAAWVATIAVAGGVAASQMLWPRLPVSGFVDTGSAHVTIAMGLIALTAAMLGVDRRFWPWSLAPMAVLLSLGPTMAVAGIPSRLVVMTWFASVAPIGLAGLLGSLWRPVAMALGRRGPSTSQDDLFPTAPAAARTPPTPRVRPIVALRAGAIGVLAVALIAVVYDPLPTQISMSLPTFLGVRATAEDTRVEMNLLLAVDALEEYRDEHRSFAGFDVATGERLAPQLRWRAADTEMALDVALVDVSRSAATLLVRSGSGAMFCARADGSQATYGAASAGRWGFRVARLEERALAACGERELTPSVVRAVDVGPMCALVDDRVLVLCRSVEGVVSRTLASPVAR